MTEREEHRNAPGERPNPLTIPAPAEKAADEVERISVEGRPADAKAGPRLLWVEIAVVAAVVLAGAVAVAIWISVVAAIAAVFLGVLALLANPSIGAALLRVRERRAASRRAQRNAARTVHR